MTHKISEYLTTHELSLIHAMLQPHCEAEGVVEVHNNQAGLIAARYLRDKVGRIRDQRIQQAVDYVRKATK